MLAGVRFRNRFRKYRVFVVSPFFSFGFLLNCRTFESIVEAVMNII